MLSDQRTRHVDRAIDGVAQLESPPVQLDLAAREARHIEEIVDQPGHVRDLTLEDLAFAGEGLRVADFHQLQGGERGRERIAQLVTEHREELILGLVGFLRFGPGRIRPANLFIALARTPFEQGCRGRERALQLLGFGDMRVRLGQRATFRDGFGGGGRGSEIEPTVGAKRGARRPVRTA